MVSKPMHGFVGKRQPLPLLLAMMLGTVGLTGCATHPNDVAPADIGAYQFNSFSCDDLAREQTRLDIALAAASETQMATRLQDIYGYIPVVPALHFPMPLGRMVGRDLEPSIAVVKGKQLAVERAVIDKRCWTSLRWSNSATNGNRAVVGALR